MPLASDGHDAGHRFAEPLDLPHRHPNVGCAGTLAAHRRELPGLERCSIDQNRLDRRAVVPNEVVEERHGEDDQKRQNDRGHEHVVMMAPRGRPDNGASGRLSARPHCVDECRMQAAQADLAVDVLLRAHQQPAGLGP